MKEYEIVIPSQDFILGCKDEAEMLRELDYVRIVLGYKDAYANIVDKAEGK